MQIRFTFGIIFLFFSCKEPQVLPPQSVETPVGVEVDTAPPKIKWMSPRFDAVIQEIDTIECQVTDTSGVALVELFVDSLNSGIIGTNTSDTTFEFSWQTTNYTNGSEPTLYIHAVDNEGNDTVSKVIRVIIDNSHAYPNPVNLYSIDSVFTDLIVVIIKKFFLADSRVG